MFAATIKIAYGSFTTTKNLDRALTTRQVIAELQTLVKNNFNVEQDAEIQIVENVGQPYSELFPELSENQQLMRENEIFFYARIVRKFNNTDYIKTDIDRYGTQRICYLKKEDLESGQEPICFTEEELSQNTLQVLQETCVICSENQVHHQQTFMCHHLVCESCLSGWRVSSTLFNCPLCRS